MGDTLWNYFTNLIDENNDKKMGDKERNKRQTTQRQSADAERKAAESKSSKEMDTVLERLQNLEQKVLKMDKNFENILDVLQQIKGALGGTNPASSSEKENEEIQ